LTPELVLNLRFAHFLTKNSARLRKRYFFFKTNKKEKSQQEGISAGSPFPMGMGTAVLVLSGTPVHNVAN